MYVQGAHPCHRFLASAGGSGVAVTCTGSCALLLAHLLLEVSCFTWHLCPLLRCTAGGYVPQAVLTRLVSCRRSQRQQPQQQQQHCQLLVQVHIAALAEPVGLSCMRCVHVTRFYQMMTNPDRVIMVSSCVIPVCHMFGTLQWHPLHVLSACDVFVQHVTSLPSQTQPAAGSCRLPHGTAKCLCRFTFAALAGPMGLSCVHCVHIVSYHFITICHCAIMSSYLPAGGRVRTPMLTKVQDGRHYLACAHLVCRVDRVYQGPRYYLIVICVR